jgi:L-ascorbate metabolism protein UlaG (beta-lactamase superfamily)
VLIPPVQIALFQLIISSILIGAIFNAHADAQPATFRPNVEHRLMTKNNYYHGPVSDHFDGVRFSNPGQPSTDRGIKDVWRWRTTSETQEWPKHVAVKAAFPLPRSKEIRVTMIGHATLLIQVDNLNILTDPVWSERTSPVSFIGPKRITDPGISFECLPHIDVVLLSHNHYDHLDMATLKRLVTTFDPLIVTPLGNDVIIKKKIAMARVVTGDWNDRIVIGATAVVTVTRANHWSNRGLFDRRMALWASFMIDTGNGRVWFSGDTGYGDGTIFKEIRKLYGAPDVALIPVGAYEPRWFMASQHVDPTEAVQIFEDLNAKYAIGIHWGTFQLTDEGREAPRQALGRALTEAGIEPSRFIAAEPGKVFEFQGESEEMKQIESAGECCPSSVRHSVSD